MLTNDDIAQYWGRQIEKAVARAKVAAVSNGTIHKWDDPEYEHKQRIKLAKHLSIPILYAPQDGAISMMWDIFHGFLQYVSHQDVLIVSKMHCVWKWEADEITFVCESFGLKYIVTQAQKWMAENTAKNINKKFVIHCTGDGFKTCINGLPFVLINAGFVAEDYEYNHWITHPDAFADSNENLENLNDLDDAEFVLRQQQNVYDRASNDSASESSDSSNVNANEDNFDWGILIPTVTLAIMWVVYQKAKIS